MPTTTTNYLDVVGFPGYRVGSDGSIWSNRPVNGRGGPSRVWRKKVAKPNERGYVFVSLMRNKTLYLVGVHRVVLEAFVGPKPDGMQCCHNDGDPSNNTVSNLRWDTPKSNQGDRVLHGTDPKGERNGRSKLIRFPPTLISRKRRFGGVV